VRNFREDPIDVPALKTRHDLEPPLSFPGLLVAVFTHDMSDALGWARWAYGWLLSFGHGAVYQESR